MAKKFVISIERTAWMDFTVTAETLEEAEEKAMEEASNTNWGSANADYEPYHSYELKEA